MEHQDSTTLPRNQYFYKQTIVPIYAGAMKRLFDIVLSLLLLPMIAPLVLLLCLMVCRDGGPGFFGHARVGKGGKTFKCWKIRTMVTDSQERLEALLKSDPAARAEWEQDRKLRNDPRVTPLGNFLRKSSLDELPQLWNVLKGEMSLIGPRPVTEPELVMYGKDAAIYEALRPGVTGLWQVSGRNDVSYKERVELDVRYHNKMSFMLDMEILFRTAKSVVSRTGC
ncbi:sugar transferase [Celeribacter sp. HF31]|uniref:sugar transferase n=1 Tax=Celeribacter sp. HF31 TaxID=2721558 RepID=UPI0020CA8E31|nr:sugar transferase [Celeribacter sp. HF31]